MKTFAEAQAEVKEIAENDRGTYIAMRHEASLALEAEARDYPEDYGFDIGSSDVSIKVIEMFRCGEMEV
jgi:hypothetical protein